MLLVSLLLIACASDKENDSSTDINQTENKVEDSVDSENLDSGNTESENDSANDDSDAEKDNKKTLIGTLNLNKSEGRIGDEVTLTAKKLHPNESLKVIYMDMEGRYDIEDDNYSFIGAIYDPIEREVATGTTDDDGNWEGTITIPEGFGDDHDIIIYQNDEAIAKANFFVDTVFSMHPDSGPVGTEIEITGEGLSPKMFGSIWHINYDNGYTGIITGVSTNGSAKAIIRASGSVGPHTLTLESGPFGSPFLSRANSANTHISTQYFTFNVTDEEPPKDKLVYIEDPPEAASGGIQLPEPKNKDDVMISLDKDMGTVGEKVTLVGEGLPKDANITFDWHTMVGSRVTPEGFGEDVWELGTAKSDGKGELQFTFDIPEDLGGLPHLIDVKVDDEIVGQTYLRILPSVVSIEPKEGPPGTLVTIEINGSGWTEFDNAMAITYDNTFSGYVCGFKTQGTIQLPFVASGEPGYHVVDIYPSIYQGRVIKPDIYTKPQLTYREDHPGTGIPAIRTLFKVTEE